MSYILAEQQSASGTLKGFGFATFMTRGHAENAIKMTNGKVRPACHHSHPCTHKGHNDNLLTTTYAVELDLLECTCSQHIKAVLASHHQCTSIMKPENISWECRLWLAGRWWWTGPWLKHASQMHKPQVST